MSDSINNFDISYSDMERAGMPNSFIEDYQSLKRAIKPQHGTAVNPEGVYKANLSGQYFDTSTPALWFNPNAGSLTGWIKIA